MAVSSFTSKVIIDVLLLLAFMFLFLSTTSSSSQSLSSPSPIKSSLPDADPKIHETVGLTLPVFHILDSPLSPYYSVDMTDKELILLFHNSQRIRNFTMLIHRTSYSVQDLLPLQPLQSGYMVSYEIGTPSIPTLSFMDTGSDLTWIQCKPCKNCYNQGEIPIFDPTSSLTYSKLPCLHQSCYMGICDTDDTCPYTKRYADGGYSTGYLSTDTISVIRENGSISQYPEIIFGCGNDNVFTVNGSRVDPPGIFGLNTHNLSIVSQLGVRFFSYCLPQRKALLGPRRNNVIFKRSYSSLRLGKAALLQGLSTPMVKVHGDKYHYFISLEGISFGAVNILDRMGVDMLFDAGASVSYLPGGIYDKVIDDMRQKIKESFIVESVEGNLCVTASNWSGLKELMPTLIFHFSGFDYMLSTENTWNYVHDVNADAVYCLAIGRSESWEHYAVFGAYQMQDMNIGFDLQENEIYFKTTNDCDIN